jgi:hypothetical protein
MFFNAKCNWHAKKTGVLQISNHCLMECQIAFEFACQTAINTRDTILVTSFSAGGEMSACPSLISGLPNSSLRQGFPNFTRTDFLAKRGYFRLMLCQQSLQLLQRLELFMH